MLSPTDSSVIYVLSPRLDWTDVPTADTYNIIISLDREFTQLVVQIPGIQESYYDIANPYLDFDDIYYWKVRGGLAGFCPWSETFSFRPISVIPPVPVLLSPSNGGINVSRNPTLDWNDVGEIYNYRVQVSRYPNFSPLIFNPGVEHSSQYTITNTLPYFTTYYWRVNATASAGTSDWSTVFSFTTIPAPVPGPPALVSPLNNTMGISLTPLLRWSFTSNSTSYYVNLSSDSSFNTILFDSVITSLLQVTVPQNILSGDSKYFWRVNATSSGGSGPWSSVWNFRTTISGVNQVTSIVPDEFKLNDNFPNPFNPVTKFSFQIPKSTFVSIDVFDNRGRKIEKIFSGMMTAGKYEVNFNGINYASGIYFYRVTTAENSETKKMVLNK